MHLKNIRDEIIIQEAVGRLIGSVSRQTKLPMKYGSFIIQIHDGRCANIDFSLKNRCFSPKSLYHGGVKNAER